MEAKELFVQSVELKKQIEENKWGQICVVHYGY